MVALMLQGTGSDVGKSVLVAGLCRAFSNRGLRVRPFKPQNMATNAATVAGGEIGGAQALQALACRTPATVHMNPVVLKPLADCRSCLVVQGKARGLMGADFRLRRASLLPTVLESFAHLVRDSDLVLVEGAGSPAEVNLRQGDIANMGFARAADVPVVLVADISRGGAIAAIVGTRNVLEAGDAAMIRGFIINKFRGDPALFADGYEIIARLSGWQGFGIVPWLAMASRLPAEDSLALTPQKPGGKQTVAVLILPHIANFDSFDPLRAEPDVELRMVPPGTPLPRAAAIILPDSVNPLADLVALRAEGWDIDLLAHHRQGGKILGLGSGFPLLGEQIRLGEETMRGLGLLAIQTELPEALATGNVRGKAFGTAFAGVETGLARIAGLDCARPFARLADDRALGAGSADGRTQGAPLHGLFAGTAFRSTFLAWLGAGSAGLDHNTRVDEALDAIAAELEGHLDLDALLAVAA